VLVMQVSCQMDQFAERVVFERDFGSADRAPGLRSGPETKNRNHDHAARPSPLAPKTFYYSLFFASYVFARN